MRWLFFYEKSSIFPLDLAEKAIFWPQTNTSCLIPSVQKPYYRIDLIVSANCENLQWYRFASRVNVSNLAKIRIKNHQSQPTSMTFWTARETNTEEHRLWLAHFFLLSDTLSSCVRFCLLDWTTLFRKMSFIHVCISILYDTKAEIVKEKFQYLKMVKLKISRGRKSQLVVSSEVVTNPWCSLSVIFWGFISHLIGRKTINIPEIFSGVHGFMGKTLILMDFKK